MKKLPSRHTIALALGMAIPALLLRALSVGQQLDALDASFSAALLIVRGICSDLVAAWLVGLAAGWLLRQRRLVYVVWTLGWGIVFAGNAEHVRFNDANFNVLHARYALTPELVTGNILVAAVVGYGLLAAAVALGCLGWLRRRSAGPRDGSGRRFGVVASLGVPALMLFVPTSLLYDGWLQEGLVETNVKHLLTRGRVGESVAPSAAREDLPASLRQKYLRQDLDGTPRFARRSAAAAEPPNVLLILVESLGAGYVREETMPFLSRFGRENMSFTSFFAHQHLTIKGLYSMLAGDYPNLRYADCKSDILGTFGAQQMLLPELLARDGYATYFLQSAPLGFMRKDLFAKEAGFQHVVGGDAFASAHGRGSWGVDDLTLFERALDEVRGLDRPWLMTLLTSGTHPPYNVPPKFRHGDAGRDPTLDDALRFADESLAALVAGLERAGQLEKTLILITSDEVKGEFPQGVEGALEHYRAPLVVHTPESYREVVREPYGHVDVALSILDYLGDSVDQPIPAAFEGRSLFRRYDSPRSLLIGRDADVVVLEGSDDVHFVSHRADEVASYRRSEAGFEPVAPARHLVGEVRQTVEASDLTYAETRSDTVFLERERRLEGLVAVVGQLAISVRQGDVLTWDVRLSTQDVAAGTVEVRIAAGIPTGENTYDYLFADSIPVDPRGRIAFRRSYQFTEDLDRVDSYLYVKTPSGQHALLEQIHITRLRR